MNRTGIAVAALACCALLVAGCSTEQNPSSGAGESPQGNSTTPADPGGQEQSQTPSLSASPSSRPVNVPPSAALLPREATDTLVSPGDVKPTKNLKKLGLEGLGTFSAQVPPEVTVKPSECANVRTWLRTGTVGSPNMGQTAYTLFIDKDPYHYVGQYVTPSAQAESALSYLTQQAQGPCRFYTETTPAQLIINNGPATDLSEKRIEEVRTLDILGWPTTSVMYRVSSRTSASVTVGTAADKWDSWLLSTAVGPNLVTTLSNIPNGFGKLHERAVEQVAQAMTDAAAEGRATSAQNYQPDNAGTAPGKEKQGTPGAKSSADNPEWPIQDIADELAAQWQGTRVSTADIQRMVLQVCRKTRDIPLTQPSQQLFAQLQTQLIDSFNLTQPTGSWNAWNVVTTAHARCQGALVITNLS